MNKKFLTLVLPVLLVACSTLPRHTVEAPDSTPPNGVIERTIDLGSGFREVTVAETSNSTFESIGHFGYLYYHELLLCQPGNYDISPSGKYAIFQDGPSGLVFLFRREDAKVIRLTNRVIAYAGEFEWHEDRNCVDVWYFKKWFRPKRTYSLK